MSEPYDLTDDELDRVWVEIRNELDEHEPPARPPTVVFLGAQPAAGKTQAHHAVAQWYGRSFFAVDSDELRQQHPRFEEIAAVEPVRLPVLVNQAASEWTRRSIAYARERQLDTLVENTFHTPETILGSAAQFHDAGYRAHVVALAVPPEVSRLAMVDRYVTSRQGGDAAARWTTLAAHDKATAGVVDTVDRVHDAAVADRLTIVDRTGTRHLDITAGTDEWTAADPAATLVQVRRDYWTDTTRAAHVRTYRDVARTALDLGAVTDTTRAVFAALVDDADRLAGPELAADPVHTALRSASAAPRAATTPTVTDLLHATRGTEHRGPSTGHD